MPGAVTRGALVTAQRLRIDLATVEVVTAMRRAGVRPILLKGPALVELLYRDDPAARAYGDVDLLVAPNQRQAASGVLADLGFERLEGRFAQTHGVGPAPLLERLRHEPPRHAGAWARVRDHVVVDLHRTIHGAERLDADGVWRSVVASAERLDVLGVPMEIPSVVTRLLHVVLHLRPTDRPGSQARRDLELAVERDPVEWERAADLARSLGLEAHMGALLRLVPRGAVLADALDLPAAWPMALRVEFDGAGRATRFLSRLTELGWTGRIMLVGEKLVPPPSYLRARSRLARRGRIGLAVSYAARVGSSPVRLLEVVRAALRRRA
ncbi:MAG: nucleotidyltransferase family protein [Acidimicrobiia bacterium]